MHTETVIVALTTFIATIGPLDVAAMFAVMTVDMDHESRRRTALLGTLYAAVILVAFALMGKFLLHSLGITLAALRTGGGILLLLIGIEMTFARSSGLSSTTEEENRETQTRQDITVFPLATPLIAGPGAMGASVLLMANVEGMYLQQVLVIGALLCVLLFTLLALLIAGRIQSLLGVTGMHVISRILGVLLTALAVQFIFDGIAQSGLIH